MTSELRTRVEALRDEISRLSSRPGGSIDWIVRELSRVLDAVPDVPAAEVLEQGRPDFLSRLQSARGETRQP